MCTYNKDGLDDFVNCMVDNGIDDTTLDKTTRMEALNQLLLY